MDNFKKKNKICCMIIKKTRVHTVLKGADLTQVKVFTAVLYKIVYLLTLPV